MLEPLNKEVRRFHTENVDVVRHAELKCCPKAETSVLVHWFTNGGLKHADVTLLSIQSLFKENIVFKLEKKRKTLKLKCFL